MKLVEVKNLRVYFPIYQGLFIKFQVGDVKAVDGVSFSIQSGETLGLVGESGCGKSTIGRALAKLVPIKSGKIFFESKDINRFKSNEFRKKVQIIFQDPTESLDPTMKIGEAIREGLDIHKLGEIKEREEKVRELMELTGLESALFDRYPDQCSQGQRQRVNIARALALGPKFLICDEVVAALDMSVQAKILNLLLELKKKLNLTYLFISHDLAAVRYISDRILVMYLGKIVEQIFSKDIFEKALHPYTLALISAVPLPDPKKARERKKIILSGEVPDSACPPSGCRFHTRCPQATKECAQVEPPLKDSGGGHLVACHKI